MSPGVSPNYHGHGGLQRPSNVTSGVPFIARAPESTLKHQVDALMSLVTEQREGETVPSFFHDSSIINRRSRGCVGVQ